MRIQGMIVAGALAVLAVASCKSDEDDGKGGGGVGGTAPLGPPPAWDRMVTPPADADAKAQRAACGYKAGSLPAETQGASHPMGKDIPINHILVLMQENRSFDHYFQMLPANGQPDVEVAPVGFTNPDQNGMPIAPFKSTNYCFVDTDHGWAASHEQYNGGLMNGFVTSNDTTSLPPHPLPDSGSGVRAMGYYDATDLPFYYWLANEYSIADHYHCSVLGPTWPNREYLYGSSSRGATKNTIVSFNDQKGACASDADCGGKSCVSGDHACNPMMDLGCGCTGACTTDTDCGLDAPVGTCDVEHGGVCTRIGRTIFDYMEQRQLDWKVYASGTPGFAMTVDAFIKYGPKHKKSTEDFFADAAAGTLPDVAFIDPHIGAEGFQQDDEHPPATPFPGQHFVATIVDALSKSPAWSSSALFITYDEHGGLFDHVPPPPACPPGDFSPKLDANDPPGEFDRLGFRVPMMVVSPFAKKHYVSHETYDHTSIVRFIQSRFVLPAISNRDANAAAPWDMFDFASPPHATAPAVTLPDLQQSKLDACAAIWEP